VTLQKVVDAIKPQMRVLRLASACADGSLSKDDRP
jgi:hypothetical protein